VNAKRYVSATCLLFTLLGFASLGRTQLRPSQDLRQATGTWQPNAHITLGQSVFPLNGPWKFTLGDSPIDPATHQPLWAKPGFNDSTWENVDLTPQADAVDPNTGTPGYVPGWTVKGHPGASGFAWYRIRVTVQAAPGQPLGKLALAGPSDVDDGYQVFANGTLLGSFGDFAKKHPVIYSAQPMFFLLPSPLASPADRASVDAPVRTELVAFRVWMDPSTLIVESDAGGLHSAPLLGQAPAIAAGYHLRWMEQFRGNADEPLEILLFSLLAVLAFSLILFDRSDPVYAWIAFVFLFSAANMTIVACAGLGRSMSAMAELLWTEVVLRPLILGVWVMVWRAWFRLRRPAWLSIAVAGLTLLYMMSNLLGEDLVYGLVSAPVADASHWLSVLVRLCFVALLVLVVVFGIRQQGREGWVALPAVLLLGVSRFQNELTYLRVPNTWFPFQIQVSLGQVADLLLVAALFVLLLRRMFFSLRAQRERALDIKQAAEVQQVMLPDAHARYPGFAVESEYRPAQEVGGDFFQILPLPAGPDRQAGSLLVVAGDVTGKGLQAGMLVALLVGAIRSTAEIRPEPVAILEALNRRLLGRKSAQATCLALLLASDGQATLANAGHIPPYLNGKPMPMEGALPLGILDGAEFSILHFALAPGDTLVMISDGVLEATDAHGRLFGFERTQQLIESRLSLHDLADAAQRFGQEDDISLISLTREPKPTPA
jgi:hypothetical protein